MTLEELILQCINDITELQGVQDIEPCVKDQLAKYIVRRIKENEPNLFM